jgi:aspartate-semialdehyde dehydrogenase
MKAIEKVMGKMKKKLDKDALKKAYENSNASEVPLNINAKPFVKTLKKQEEKKVESEVKEEDEEDKYWRSREDRLRI